MEQAVSRALTFPKDFPSAEEIPQPGTSEPLQRQTGFKSWMSSPAQATSAAQRIHRQPSPFLPGSSRDSLFPPGFPFIRHPNGGKGFCRSWSIRHHLGRWFRSVLPAPSQRFPVPVPESFHHAPSGFLLCNFFQA